MTRGFGAGARCLSALPQSSRRVRSLNFGAGSDFSFDAVRSGSNRLPEGAAAYAPLRGSTCKPGRTREIENGARTHGGGIGATDAAPSLCTTCAKPRCLEIKARRRRRLSLPNDRRSTSRFVSVRAPRRSDRVRASVASAAALRNRPSADGPFLHGAHVARRGTNYVVARHRRVRERGTLSYGATCVHAEARKPKTARAMRAARIDFSPWRRAGRRAVAALYARDVPASPPRNHPGFRGGGAAKARIRLAGCGLAERTAARQSSQLSLVATSAQQRNPVE